MTMQIEHFMWGYQNHFRVHQEYVAKSLFKLLDDRFDPEIFLVGVLVEKRSDRYPACVEPEDGFWIQSEEFDSTLEGAKEIIKTYPERQLLHSHPLMQQAHDDSLINRSIRDAVQQIINKKNTDPLNLTYYVAPPSKVEGFLVCVVLKLQSAILKSHPSLHISRIPLHPYRYISVATSLIDAVITNYLQKVAGELRLPEPGSDISGLNAEEILREAANKLMMNLAYKADQRCFVGSYRLFSNCNNIAATNYEKAAGRGTVVLAGRKHPSIQTIVQFTSPMSLELTRGARKHLQLASQEFALHTDSENIYGLAKLRAYDSEAENLYTINFLEHHHWEVAHADRVLMRVKYGQPYLPKPPFNAEKLRKDLPRICLSG